MHNEEVVPLDIETLATIVVLVTTIGSSHALLRREFKTEIAGLRQEVKSDIKALDDRVYQLATGLKPLIEQAQRVEHKN